MTLNTMIIRGEEYRTPLALWHDGKGNPKKIVPPSQFPDLGGISEESLLGIQ